MSKKFIIFWKAKDKKGRFAWGQFSYNVESRKKAKLQLKKDLKKYKILYSYEKELLIDDVFLTPEETMAIGKNMAAVSKRELK